MSHKLYKHDRLVLLCGLCALLALAMGCDKVRHFRDHKSVLDRVKSHPPVRVSPRAFRVHKALSPKRVVAASWQGRRFVVLRRTDAITRFPCKSCHTKPVPVRKGTIRRSPEFVATHGAIGLKHAAPGVLRCQSCHNPGDLQTLRTPTGEVVSFNQSHKLCGSCHQRQTKDWAGGAHGKRIGRWYGQRAIFTCTQCHNPHTPLSRFGKRWPKAYFLFPAQQAHK